MKSTGSFRNLNQDCYNDLPQRRKLILIFLMFFFILSYGYVILLNMNDKEQFKKQFEEIEEKLSRFNVSKRLESENQVRQLEKQIDRIRQQQKAQEERIKKLNRMWNRYGERPKIYTYFEYVEAMREEEHLLELWAESWWYYGWRPVVLDRSMAERHLEFQKWNQTFSRYPSINRKEYEMACYHRWIAMAVVGDGFLSDMDVINYGFKPPSQIPSNFTLYQGFIPALASASKQEYERIVNELASIDVNSSTILLDGRPHLSDMYIFKKLLNKNPPSILSNCSLFSGEKLLEHWSHNVAGGGLNRAKIIPHIRKHPAWSYREGPTYTEEIKQLLKQKNLL